MVPVHINYLAVLVAGLVNYAIGAVWFGALFGKPWMALSGIKEMKPSVGPMLLGLVGSLLMSFVLAHAIVFASAYMKAEGLGGGLMAGFWNWLGFVAPVTLSVVIYEKKSWKLWFIDNGYWLIALLAMGAILSAWK
jgi:hypothetical protein